MFDFILTFLGGFKDWLSWLLSSVWDTFVGWFKSAWSVFIAVLGWVWWAFDTIKESITLLVGAIDRIIFPNLTLDGSGLGYYFNLCNTFFPLQEMFAFCIAYLALIVALTLFKIIKEFAKALI